MSEEGGDVVRPSDGTTTQDITTINHDLNNEDTNMTTRSSNEDITTAEPSSNNDDTTTIFDDEKKMELNVVDGTKKSPVKDVVLPVSTVTEEEQVLEMDDEDDDANNSSFWASEDGSDEEFLDEEDNLSDIFPLAEDDDRKPSAKVPHSPPPTAAAPSNVPDDVKAEPQKEPCSSSNVAAAHDMSSTPASRASKGVRFAVKHNVSHSLPCETTRAKVVPKESLGHVDDNNYVEEHDYHDNEIPMPTFLKRHMTADDTAAAADTTTTTTRTRMSMEDMSVCEKLDEEYERALEEREIGYTARYNSVRQSACLSVTFMMIFLSGGTVFFLRQAPTWQVNEALLFSIYTITTVGYGTLPTPDTARYQLFTILYVFVGIATLTIMVAQVYQYIALEATRAQHARDKADLARQGRTMLENNSSSSGNVDDSEDGGGGGDGSNSTTTSRSERSAAILMEFLENNAPNTHAEVVVDRIMHWFEKCRIFLTRTEFGRGLSVLFPFAGLILIGAIVVGPIEGWSVVESFYFAVVSLTTVGYGDYAPTRPASIWFCIFWLPFSIGFMSLFLGNVASFYIRLSDRNVRRMEIQMRFRLQQEKEAAERERRQALRRAMRGQQPTDIELGNVESPPATSKASKSNAAAAARQRANRESLDGFASLPTGDVDTSDEDAGPPALFDVDGDEQLESELSMGHKRRQMIIAKSKYRQMDEDDDLEQPTGQTMATMNDVICTVKANLIEDCDERLSGPETRRFMSLKAAAQSMDHGYLRRRSVSGTLHINKRPPFALRVLVQERFAEIIATEIAGFQSNVEIQGNTLAVTIDTLKVAAEKWLVPRRARKAFRAVAFEALYFVGEHGLITRGADVLYDLTPFEFHGLFSPLLAAMGDADTMNGWLASTEVLAEVDLRSDSERQGLAAFGGARSLADLNPQLAAAKQTRRSQEQAEKLKTVYRRQSSSFGASDMPQTSVTKGSPTLALGRAIKPHKLSGGSKAWS